MTTSDLDRRFETVLPPKRPGPAGKRATPRAFVFASDPQYPWTPASDLNLEQSAADRDQESAQLINQQYANIADYRAHMGGTAIPVMINGDMTAYGHAWQRRVLYPILERHLQDNYYFGLGNHDYENNTTFNNGAARDSILDLIDHHRERVDTMDISAITDRRQTHYSGSLAYSMNFGRVRLIQLNNEPTYELGFQSGWAWPLEHRHRFDISGSLQWLEGQLQEAYDSGQIILLNLHKPNDWHGSWQERANFRNLINHFRVDAVFAGHVHREPGRWYRDLNSFGNAIPVYLSGSASQSTYLIAELNDSADSLSVRLVRGNDWRSAEEIDQLQLYKP